MQISGLKYVILKCQFNFFSLNDFHHIMDIACKAFGKYVPIECELHQSTHFVNEIINVR